MNFDLEWVYDIYILEIWHVFSIIFSVVFIMYICLNGKKSLLLYHYLAVQGILLIWMICKVFKTIAPDAGIKWFFIVFQYFALCFMGSALLMFGYLYARGRPIGLEKGILLNIPPALFFLVVATNPYHLLFYSSYDFLGDTFGPAFYIFTAVSYAYLGIGIYFCATCFKQQFDRRNLQSGLFALGIVVPLIVNALYVCGIIEPRFDLTPISCNISLIIFAYAIYRYRFLDIVPIGVSHTLNNMKEGIIVLDGKGRVTDVNKAFLKIFGLDVRGAVYKSIEEMDKVLCPACMNGDGGIVREVVNREGGTRKEFEFCGREGTGKSISLSVKPVKYGMRMNTGWVCVFYDMTEYRKLIKRLEEKREELERAGREMERYVHDLEELTVMEERNRMAKEIHDVLGHSLTLVLAILESCKILIRKDISQVPEKLKLAISIAQSGIRELDNALRNKGKNVKSAEQLELELEQMADRYRTAGMEVDIEVRSRLNSLDSEFFHVVFRICQEALTNAMRHGKAEKANVFLKVGDSGGDIFIMDDGVGCKDIKRGHGINGMEQRVNRLGGILSYGSPDGKGFTVHARIPAGHR